MAFFLTIVKVGDVAPFPGYSLPFEDAFVVRVEKRKDGFNGEAFYFSAKDSGDLPVTGRNNFGFRVDGKSGDGVGDGFDDPNEGPFLGNSQSLQQVFRDTFSFTQRLAAIVAVLDLSLVFIFRIVTTSPHNKTRSLGSSFDFALPSSKVSCLIDSNSSEDPESPFVPFSRSRIHSCRPCSKHSRMLTPRLISC